MLVEAKEADEIPVSVLTHAYIRCLLQRACEDQACADSLPQALAAEPCVGGAANGDYDPFLWGSSIGSDDDDNFVAFDFDNMPLQHGLIEDDPFGICDDGCTSAPGAATPRSHSSKFMARVERMGMHAMIHLEWMAECLERQGLALDRAAVHEVQHIARLFLCAQDKIESVLEQSRSVGEKPVDTIGAVQADSPQKGMLSSSPTVRRSVQAVRRASHRFEKGAGRVRAALSTSSTVQRGLGIMQETSRNLETGVGASREIAQVCTESARTKVKVASTSASDKLHGGLRVATGRMREVKGAVQRVVLHRGGA